MSKNKSTILKSSTYSEIGEYWDQHDLTDVWDQIEYADFSVTRGNLKGHLALGYRCEIETV